LFVDDALVQDMQGLVRSYHVFERYPGNPVMVADQPWEDSYVYLYGRVMPDEGGSGYRMWYSCLDFHDPAGGSRVLYATSPDGLTWQKPELGIRTYNGSTDNNLFIPRDRPNHILSVMHTPWDRTCTYKFINFDGAFNGLPSGYNAACSAHGIYLNDLVANPVIDAQTVGVGDVGHFLYDPWAQRYRGYVKVAATVAGRRRRAVGLVESERFDNWPTTPPTVVLAPDALDDFWVTNAGLELAFARTHFYGVAVFPYQTMLLGLLWIFRSQDPPNCGHDCEPETGYIFGKIHVELVSSRDGVVWTRVAGDFQNGRPPLLDLGPAGSFDSMMVFTANHPLVEGDRIKLYYGGCNEDHGRIGSGGACAVGLATLRRDGFISVDAGSEVGQLTTRMLTGAAGELRVNFQAAVGGSVKVAVLDQQGQELPGYGVDDCTPLTGDHVDQAVRWGSRSTLPAFPCTIALRFTLQQAALYSFAAGERVRVVQ
jgi:hypothetical protein